MGEHTAFPEKAVNKCVSKPPGESLLVRRVIAVTRVIVR